jgi:anti-sigma factor (TIGR02949 family)
MAQIDRYTCEQVFRRLDDYLDRELTDAEMELVHEHLETCANCASEHEFQASVLREVKSRVRRIGVPSDLLAKVSRALDAVGAE